ncbi:MAG: PorV/PorQ family protein [FCB group bacterium]|nr:PorV/PorQ family protein [FCB group bacterium]
MKRTVILTILLLELGTFARSQNFFPILGGQRVGTSSFTFLKIGASARAVGMGEAVVAMNQDAASIYYNPATLAQLRNTELVTSRVNWPADISYDFISVTHHLTSRHYLGFSAGILHMSPMEETTEYLPHGTGNYFTYQDRFIGLTYAVKLTDRFSFGITLKDVQEDLAGIRMRVALLDMGTFYWTGYKSLRFSAALSHFGSQAAPDGTYEKRVLDSDTGNETVLKTAYQEFSPPTLFQVGAAMEIIERPLTALTLSVQLNHPVDDAEYVLTGMEYQLFHVLYLRSGIKLGKEEEGLSAGLGLSIPLGSWRLNADYSWTNMSHLSDPVRFSIGLGMK